MCMYILEIIYYHIDHTLWSTKCLWLCSLILGESCLKTNSYNNKWHLVLTLKIGQMTTWEDETWGTYSLSHGEYECNLRRNGFGTKKIVKYFKCFHHGHYANHCKFNVHPKQI